MALRIGQFWKKIFQTMIREKRQNGFVVTQNQKICASMCKIKSNHIEAKKFKASKNLILSIHDKK